MTPAAHFLLRFTAALPRRHETLSEFRTVGRPHPMPLSCRVVWFFAATVHDLGFAPSLAVTPLDVPAI